MCQNLLHPYLLYSSDGILWALFYPIVGKEGQKQANVCIFAVIYKVSKKATERIMDGHKHNHHDGCEHHHDHAFGHEHKGHHDHHAHHHALGHHHHSATGNIKVAFWLNILFALFELVGGFFTSSIAILSDALHDFGDALSLGVAWYLQKLSERGRDAHFSYGYKRFSLLGALFISIVLVVGSIFVLTAAAQRLINPGEPKAGWMLLIAVVGLSVNGVAALRMSKGHSFNERAVMLHLLEDVLGWAAVLVVSLVMVFVNLPILDPILSIAISCWVLFNVVRTLIGTFKVFLQGVPTDIDLPRLEGAIQAMPEVDSIHDVHLWSVDGELHVLTLHVVFYPEACPNPEALLQLKERVRTLAKEAGVQHATIEMDAPDTPCGMEHCCD